MTGGWQVEKITVVGSGYVGLVAAACFAELGHSVICVDNDLARVETLRGGGVPIHEQFLPELLARHRGAGLEFSSSLPEAVRSSSIIFIAVGTPPKENGEADLSYVESVAREIAQNINGYKVIIEKSTVPVYTSDWIRRVMHLTTGADCEFDVVSNPEFLREGTAVTDFLYPDRIVVGADSPRAAALISEVYAPLTTGNYYLSPERVPEPDGAASAAQLILTTAKSAELIKHASNAFLAMKISFINAVANICEEVGADIEQVSRGVGSDSRIGPRFLRAGIGYGGSCFPKDVSAFRAVARECGYEFDLLDAVMGINEDQRLRFMKKIRTALWTLKGKKLGVLGLAFKGRTDDIRESPAIALVQQLLAEGACIRAFDPAAMERTREIFQDRITFTENPYQAAEDADALLILTDWEEFATLDLKHLRKLLKYPIILDGRNLYTPEEMEQNGFMYVSVGRKPSSLKQFAKV
jgi:UDPglucose 6-dehydrogenase